MKIALIKRGSMVIAGIALLWVLGACSSSAKSTETGTPAPYNDPNIPPWINEIAPEDVIWGIGSAKQSSESSP
jgi:ABC-type oligopeptide transport system substrate-binding subunit